MSAYLAKTVMRQFSNSATLLALLADFDQWVDVSEFSAEFLANVWDISTAQGFGLDIWGRILGQSRYIQVEQTPGDNFGFNINPASGTVNAINQEFGVGNGSTTAFQLLGPDHRPANTGVVINSMTRQDWQGVQSLFPTARTNLLPHSQDTAAGTPTRGTTTNAAAAGADGGQAVQFTETTANGGHHFGVAAGSYAAGSYAYAIQLKPNGRSYIQLQLMGNAASVNLTLIGSGAIGAVVGPLTNTSLRAIANGSYLFKGTITIGALTAVPSVDMFSAADSTFALSYTGDGTSGFYFRVHMEQASTAGSYIPTAASPVTLTDYSVSGTGLVTFAQTPVGPASPGGAAVLRWNGTYTGTIVGTQWQPWSQAPWFGGAAAGTTAFPLPDDYYRQLLLVKAAANIASCDCPSINALMRSMFGSRGRCYVGYDPANPMHIGYHFEFFPSVVEKSIIESGLFPQPAGTTATYIYQTLSYTPFGFAGANRGADPVAVTGWSQHPFYQP